MASSRASSPIVVISDDEEKPVAAVLPEAEHGWPPTADWSEDEDVPRPDWLPDGFGMEGYLEDGTFQATNFICPVTGISFGTKNEVLDYCGSGGLERAIEAKNTLDDKTTLQGKYAWFRGDHKWLLEIRRAAGWENGRKMMYKVYAHPSSKVRITSKTEVMRLIDEGKLPYESTNDGDCNDTSNKDNIIAQLDFNVSCLPPGWVKETTFKKCSGGIRTDRYYTDPVTKKVFRSLMAAEQYFKYEKIMDCYKPTMSVTDLYSFDGCVDMPLWLARRVKMDGTKDQCEEECQTSCCQTLIIEVGEDGKEVLHADSKEKLDEEECHGDDKKEEDKEEALNGDGNEKEYNEEMPHGDGKEDEDETGALRGSDKVGVNGEGMPCGDGVEDGRRFRSLTELYSLQIKKVNLKRKGKKE